jgi:hypothetical protein
MTEHPEWDGVERRDEPATTGAQEQIDEIRREMRYGLRAMMVGGVLFIIAVLVVGQRFIDVAQDASDAVATAEAERAARAESVKGIVDLFCAIDNNQDSILAELVAASVESGGTFGKGIDLTALTDFDVAVLSSIAKVQELDAGASDTHLERTFERNLRELEDLTPCQEIIDRYVEAEEIPSLEELDARHRVGVTP